MKVNKIFVAFAVLLVCVLGYGFFSSKNFHKNDIFSILFPWRIQFVNNNILSIYNSNINVFEGVLILKS